MWVNREIVKRAGINFSRVQEKNFIRFWRYTGSQIVFVVTKQFIL